MKISRHDSDQLVPVATHLTAAESESLGAMLHANRIKHLISGHDAASQYNNLYYQVLVKTQDARVAQALIKIEMARRRKETLRCPRCKSPSSRPVTKLRFWEKFFFMGTTVVECTKCKKKFPI